MFSQFVVKFICQHFLLPATLLIFYPQECETELSVFNITWVRQQAEMEVKRQGLAKPTLIWFLVIMLQLVVISAISRALQVCKKIHPNSISLLPKNLALVLTITAAKGFE